MDLYEYNPENSTPLPEIEPEVSHIPRHNKTGFVEHILELTPKNETETAKEKFNRIRSDLFLLHEQVDREALNKTGRPSPEFVDDLKLLLCSLDKKLILGEEPTMQTSLRCARLEQRVADLEKELGLDTDQPMDVSLFKRVDEIRTRLQILAPGFLQNVHQKLQELGRQATTVLARVDPNKDGGLTKEDKVPLAELEELVKRWDQRCTQLAPQVEKIKTDEQLYVDAERVLSKYAKLAQMRSSFKQSLELFHKQVELDQARNQERLQQLTERIKAVKDSSA